MIYGIGTDIVNIDRIKSILEKNQKRFASKILTVEEYNFYNNNKSSEANYFAKRFAAKEAFSKALGTGIGKDLSFQDICIKNDNKGKPYFSFSKKIQNYLDIRDIKNTFISISDENDNAIAFVILEK